MKTQPRIFWLPLMLAGLVISSSGLATAQETAQETAQKPALPQPVARKLITRVAKDTRIVANKLQISEVKTANFDGCLGVYRPNQGCTRQVISGYSVLVTSPDRTYVYNLSTDAGQIAQNDTASGARKAVRVSFDFFGGPVNPSNEPKLVFRSTTSGDLTGRMSRTELTTDGKVTRYTSAPNIRTMPVVLKTLTPRQLKAFQKVLETQRFRNLNGLSYLTSAALADYPTTGYETGIAAMQFIDLEKASLPRSLQGLIKSWDALVN